MTHDNPAIAEGRSSTGSPTIAMAAHNPLAAKLAARGRRRRIRGSGFGLSASCAVPDANILSVVTRLDLMRAMGEVQDAPVIADICTGDGNAVKVACLIPREAPAWVAAVVMEDKTLPKHSSLWCGARQVLVPILSLLSLALDRAFRILAA